MPRPSSGSSSAPTRCCWTRRPRRPGTTWPGEQQIPYSDSHAHSQSLHRYLDGAAGRCLSYCGAFQRRHGSDGETCAVGPSSKDMRLMLPHALCMVPQGADGARGEAGEQQREARKDGGGPGAARGGLQGQDERGGLRAAAPAGVLSVSPAMICIVSHDVFLCPMDASVASQKQDG